MTTRLTTPPGPSTPASKPSRHDLVPRGRILLPGPAALVLFLAIWIASPTLALPAQLPTNAPGMPRAAFKTNTAAARFSRTNTPPGQPTGAGAITNKAALKGNGTNAPASFKQQFEKFKASPAFLPAVIGAVVVLLGLVVLGRMRSGKKTAVVPASIVSKAVVKAGKPQAKPATVHACNILEIGPVSRQVWQFEARGSNFVLSREHTSEDGEGLPARLVAKSWRSLFYRKLNIAYLPPEHVFLRVIHLPRSDFGETLSMVELQLEKLSPLPAAQTVWSIHTLPHAEDNLQTVIVMIVARNVVEEFLGKLEGQGFLADRLELPLLDQLQATAITEDGAYIYPEAGGGKSMALVAWWYGGVLQNLDLLTVPAGDRAAGVREQLTQMAWAGEMEGWLKAAPDWHLVADAVVAGEWEPMLRQGLEQPVEVSTPLPVRDLAALTARRSAVSDPRANLMPPEFATRYQQQFVDRLWMRGLLALGAVYAIGVMVYMVALGYVNYKTTGVEKEVAQMGASYTNALQLKARWQVLKDREELKYAALDCWKTTAQHLPADITLESLNFSQGKHLRLNGTAPADAFSQVNEFESAMRKSTVNGQPLFDTSRGESVDWRVQGSSATWTLGLDLKRSEELQ